MKFARNAILTVLLAMAPVFAQEAAPAKCEGLPPGRHANLERMTAAMKLTCEQQLKIEPLLHDEESVSKPLQKFSSFSAEERGDVMNVVKIAARRQIKSELTPEQQKWMDGDIASVKGGGGGGGKKGGGKEAAPAAPVTAANALDDEEALSKAVTAYAALSSDERRSMLLQIKKAARNDGNLPLTAEQKKKLDTEIAELFKGGK
jgi:Spy/CpxP family protein refolding chaperone